MSPKARSLEVKVNDFGPIVEARIDLRPLTVFVGPSNTGKSYLAILLYALHRYFSGSTSSGYRIRRRLGTRPSRAMLKAIGKWGEATFDAHSESPPAKVAIPTSIVSAVCSEIGNQGDLIAEEISRCFGTDSLTVLMRRASRSGARLALRRHVDAESVIEHRLTVSPTIRRFETSVPDASGFETTTRQSRGLEHVNRLMGEYATGVRTARPYYADRVVDALTGLVLPHILGPLHTPAFYLPADRTGVMHAHSAVVSALIGSAPMAAIRPAPPTPTLSGVLADFLQQLLELDRPARRGAKFGREAAGQIEDNMLRGAVRVDRSAIVGYPRFVYRPSGWQNDLPLMNASSMVSELAPVVLYLRHMVRVGDLLIVEEPESHLHPAMQVQLTRFLALLVKSGLRVIITTHSEWVLEELANIVRRSELRGVREAGNRVGAALDRHEAGAWLFRPKQRPKGSVVTEIELDEAGLYPTGFEEVAAALHNDWAEISSRLGARSD